jgi:hypothetical protein
MIDKKLFPIVRLIPNDDPTAREWLESNLERNHFDERILRYPTLRLMQCEIAGRRIAVLPMHPVVMLESVGVAPDANPVEQTRALFEMVQTAALEGLRNGCQEVCFMASDPATKAVAEQLGFQQESVLTLMRLRLPLVEELK